MEKGFAVQAALISFQGVVQGVGFRPWVYKAAREMEIKGWVNNTTSGVRIHAEGPKVQAFYDKLVRQLPPMALVTGSDFICTAPLGYKDFRIIDSTEEKSREVLVSPDLSVCPECIDETIKAGNRRYLYPFTNCTNCGPRYSIISDVPYDREYTTMHKFAMCPECRTEYLDPLDRRFHAQPIACPVCGPRVTLVDRNGKVLPGLGIKQLRAGAILAVKGIGGFHLVCDALNHSAVEQLRKRKKREFKPFALMVKNLEVLRKYCVVSQAEETVLRSRAAPIVILNMTQDAKSLPKGLAPNLNTLGVMLPYTPLHHLLLEQNDLLVMTSANVSGEPLITDNTEASAKLMEIADYWLMHDRDIFHPIDDSVIRVVQERPVFFRRARGYVPLPIDLDSDLPPVIGMGGDLKNTFCLLKGKKAFISQFGGDLSNYANYRLFLNSINSFGRIANITPDTAAYDLHPEYQSSRHAKSIPNVYKIGIQHHHAHFAGCLAENKVRDKVLGVICDGTGYGLDGHIWGFEFLFGDRACSKRVAHLEYLPLPGGDRSSRFPSRIAAAYLLHLLGGEVDPVKYLPGISPEEVGVIWQQVRAGTNSFLSSSCGRLFDAVAALTGFASVVTYEGQAAIELEAAVDCTEQGTYEFELDQQELLLIRVRPLFEGIITDLEQKIPRGKIAAKFHNTVVEIIHETVKRLGDSCGKQEVALSGGVFQNKYLTESLVPKLETEFRVYMHSHLPPGDGGLCLGQAVAASEVMKHVPGHSCEGT